MMIMVEVWGDIAFIATSLGINAFLLFFLLMTRWYKSFMTISIVVFFAAVAVILDLSIIRILVPSVSDFVVNNVRTPLYLFLALSVWVMLGAAVKSQFARRETKKIDVSIPKK